MPLIASSKDKAIKTFAKGDRIASVGLVVSLILQIFWLISPSLFLRGRNCGSIEAKSKSTITSGHGQLSCMSSQFATKPGIRWGSILATYDVCKY